MTSLLMPMYVALVVYLPTTGRKLGFLSVSNIFIYMQLIMATGTMPLLDETVEADSVNAFLLLTTFLVVLVMTSVLTMLLPRMRQVRFAGVTSLIRPGFATWLLIVFSVLVCIVYYNAVGYLTIVESIKSVFSGASDDIAGLRLEAYAGDRYLLPGYVNQFKNVLLPALVAIVIPYYFRVRNPFRYIVALGLVALTLTFILGTGQRGAFVMFMIALVLYVYYINRKKFLRYLIAFVALGLPIFIASTIALGRSSAELAAAKGPMGQLFVLIGQVFYRIFGSNQDAAVAGFRYIYAAPNQAGADWLQSVLGILPGVAGSDLDNRIFATLYGSTRGTAPPSLWGSTYYNFGFLGSVVCAVLVAVLLFLVATMIGRYEEINAMQAIGFAGISATLGTWVAGTPVVLLNAGIIAYVFLWWWGRRRQCHDEVGDLRNREHLKACEGMS